MPSQPSPEGLSYIPPSSPVLCFPLPSYAWRLLLKNHSNNSRANSPNHHTSSPSGLCMLLPGFGVHVKSHSSGQILYYLLPDWHTAKAVFLVKPVPGKPGQWRPASDRTRWKPPRSAGSPHSAVLSLPTLPPAPMWLRITGLSFPCQLSYLGDKESGGERICAEDSGQPDNPTYHLQSPKLVWMSRKSGPHSRTILPVPAEVCLLGRAGKEPALGLGPSFRLPH